VAADPGGGIRNSGTLTLSGMAVVSNRAGNGGDGIVNGTGGQGGFGGGIYNAGTLTITDSTISGNKAGNGGGAQAAKQAWAEASQISAR
jgi:hypothetical protein